MTSENQKVIGGLDEPPPKRRVLTGVNKTDDRYAVVLPKATDWCRKIVPQTNALSDPNITFQIKAAHNEYIRFPDEALCIIYHLHMRNANFAVGGANEEARSEWLAYVPSDVAISNPQLFIQPLLGMRTFIGDVQVSLDNHRLDDKRISANEATHYHMISRLMTSDSIRRSKLGNTVPSTTRRRDFLWTQGAGAAGAAGARAPVRSAELIELQKSITYTARIPGAQQPHMMTGGLEGIFPFACQNPTLRAITKQERANGFLPTGTDIRIELAKRSPTNAFLENACVNDDTYFYSATLEGEIEGGGSEATVDLKWIPVAIGLCYESLVINSPERRKTLDELSSKHIHDKPYVVSQVIAPGTQYQQVRLPLEAGTKLVYFVTMPTYQLASEARPGNFISTRYRLMDRLKSVSFSIGEHHHLAVSEGLKDVDLHQNGQNTRSMSLRYLHQDLHRQGIVSKSWNEWTPTPTATKEDSYNKLIPIDLTNFTIKEGDELVVTMTFTAEGSRANYHAVAFGVQQVKITCGNDHVWREEPVL